MNSSEWTWIFDHPNRPLHSSIWSAYEGQLRNKTLAWIHLLEGLVNLQKYSVVVSPNSKCIVEISVLQSWQNPRIGYLAHGVKAAMLQRKSGGLWPHYIQKGKKKNVHHLWCNPKELCHHQRLKKYKNSTLSPFKMPLWLWRNVSAGEWEEIIGNIIRNYLQKQLSF